MLTPHETAELRARAVASQYRRTDERRTGVRLVGGPLDGLRLALPVSAARSMYVAWCIVRHDGPVQAVYRREADGMFRFDGWAAGVR